MFGRRPRLPVDLLFPTVNNPEWTHTIDEYVKALYEGLRECLKLAQESATKEANRQKQLYDRRVGAVELHPGDRVLVHLDAFWGQRRKLKNPWGDDIHTVIDRKTDTIPVYEVKNERTGKKKVLHQARLLLWLADYGEPVRCNLMVISDKLPGMVPGQQLDDSGEGLHPVPGESLQYGLDLTHFRAIIDNPELMTSRIGHEPRMGIPRQAAGHGIPTDCEEKLDPDSLGSYAGDTPVSWAATDRILPTQLRLFPSKIRGKCKSTGRVSCYLADLVPTTEVCPVTYTENLSNVWTTADYPLWRLVSHVWHEGVPPFSHGEWWTIPYARKRIYRMSCIFLVAAHGRIKAWITGYNFFVFTEWHHRRRNYGWLSMSYRVRVIPVLCVQTARCYGQGMTMTTMYIIQLFIYKRLG